MSETLLSSGDFSELSDIVDDNMVVTPKCPICQRNYTQRIKPMSLQPCGHGVCTKCLKELKDRINNTDSEGYPMDPLCPLCRVPIVHDCPNYDLREITSNVNHDYKVGYWEKHISEMSQLNGRNITFSRELRPYAKVICVRIAFDEVLVHTKGERKD